MTDLPDMAPDVFAIWLDGWTTGRTEGIARGRELADEEAANRHRAAADVLLAMRNVPEVDRAAAAARRARWDARFAPNGGA